MNMASEWKRGGTGIGGERRRRRRDGRIVSRRAKGGRIRRGRGGGNQVFSASASLIPNTGCMHGHTNVQASELGVVLPHQLVLQT